MPCIVATTSFCSIISNCSFDFISAKSCNICLWLVLLDSNSFLKASISSQLSLITDFKHDYVLITNSDILTNIDYEHFFLDFINQNADMAIVTIPYNVNIPYAVLDTDDGQVLSFKEKPTFTYYSNGGIYLIKRHLLDHLPLNEFYNALFLDSQASTFSRIKVGLSNWVICSGCLIAICWLRRRSPRVFISCLFVDVFVCVFVE